MNRFWYSLILYLAFPLLIIYLAIRAIKSPDYRSRWSERFALATVKKTDVLIHTASVGETIAALPLIRKIIAATPDINVTITTTSPTGSAEVIKAFGDRVQHIYLPVDISVCVKRFLRQLQPSKILILETELWPNLLHFAKVMGIEVMLTNARLSAKSAASYQKWPKLTSEIMATLDKVAVQTQIEQQRFIELGLTKDIIEVTGSLKFDVNVEASLLEKGKALRHEWNKQGVPVWIAGSVHPGEFEQVINAHKSLLQQHPNSLLIMVPRHPEKFEECAHKIEQSGLLMSRRSKNEIVDVQTQVLLGDTMGELMLFYSAADQAFIGGSLIEHGGQNPLEAAAIGLGLIMGCSRYNFTDICQLLEDAGAMASCHDGDSLAAILDNTFSQQDILQQRQAQAKAVVMANRGAVDKQYRLFKI